MLKAQKLKKELLENSDTISERERNELKKFRASRGWLQKFMKRNSLVNRKSIVQLSRLSKCDL